MDFVEIQATFVVPEDSADTFANVLSGVIASLAIPSLTAERFWYYGVWANEWYGADPLSGDGVIVYSEGIKFSREKNASPSLDNESSHVRSREDVIAEHIESKNIRVKVNIGVAPHVITRKYYPDPRCLTQCTMRNTDYCRLACDEERLEALKRD